MNITGFHDSALCCVGAAKNSLDIYSLPWGATILVKTVGTIRAFSPSPITMLIFHGLQSQDPFIDSWHVSTLSGGEGERKKGNERRTNVAHITMEACTVNSLLFAQNLTSVPKGFHPDCDVITLNNVCKVPLFSWGTLPQLSRPRHSVAFVFATAEVFVQPR